MASTPATTIRSANASLAPTLRNGLTGRGSGSRPRARSGCTRASVAPPRASRAGGGRARVAVVGALPERLEQHAPAEDPPGLRGQGAQQLELDVGQLHRRTAHLDDPPWHVDPQAVVLDHLLDDVERGVGGTRATQQRAHARAELAD